MDLRNILISFIMMLGFSGAFAHADADESMKFAGPVVQDTSPEAALQLVPELIGSLSKPLSQPLYGYSYFDWGQARNGWGYCYEWASSGGVLNEGRPVSNWYCEQNNPSRYHWGQARNGWGYCYQYTPYGVAMNEGSPVSNYNCEAVAPSFYRWGRARNGYTYCYQYTANGYVMNEGSPVSDYYCRY